jgi:hypothetical protein
MTTVPPLVDRLRSITHQQTEWFCVRNNDADYNRVATAIHDAADVLENVQKRLLPSYVTGPSIKWREDEHGLHLIKAQVCGYNYESVMNLLGVDVTELKRLDDIERQRFLDFCAKEWKR